MNDTQVAVVPQKTGASALAVMAAKFNVEPAKLHSTLAATVFKNASAEEMLALVVVANAYGLNPLTKEIYAFPAKGGGIVPVVSVDGWMNMMNSHPQFDGLECNFEHEGEKLISCTATIWRKDRSRPIKVTEYLAECKRQTDPWKMEHRMLRHKATSQCIRTAFGFSGVHDEDEAKDITPIVREIPRAVIVADTATELAPKEAAAEVIPPPAKKRTAPKTEAPKEPVKEAESVAPEARATEEVIGAFLNRDGFTEAQLLDLARKLQLAPESATRLPQITEENQKALIADWEQVKAMLTKGGN